MTEPGLEQIAPRGIVGLSDAPGGLDDATFDSLFPAEPTPLEATLQVQSTPPVTPAATPPVAPAAPAPQTPATPSFPPAIPFLRGSRSVYNSPEAAIEGINEKDALIEQLRQRYALTTGIDPITGKRVEAVVAGPVESTSYFENPNKYLEDLYAAAKTGGPEAYRDVQAKFIMDSLAPLQPVIQSVTRQTALATVSKDTPAINQFVGSAAYDKTLEAVPELKNAIAVAETDYRYSSRLPQLYKLAFLAGQGIQLPDLLRANAQASAAQTSTPGATIRPTLTPSTSALPQHTIAPNMRSLQGIRATIADAEARGVKLDF